MDASGSAVPDLGVRRIHVVMSIPTNYDPVLKMVIELSAKMADTTDVRAEAGVTLNVGGLLISGYITSARQFMLSHIMTDKCLEAAERPFKDAGMLSQETVESIHLTRATFCLPGHL